MTTDNISTSPVASGRRGLLIAFEGIDGTGKSTQIKLLTEVLINLGHQVIATREPTDGEFGRRIRQLYENRDTVTKEEELELFIADRRQHVTELIEPALQNGKIVLTDRYYFSTTAYQGANGMDSEEILRRNKQFAPQPDLVLLIEIPVAEGLRRIKQLRGETPNNFEQEAYLEKVSAVFGDLREDFISRINGLGNPEEVHARIMIAVDKLLAGNVG